MNRVLILASGGMDSTVLMAHYKRLNYDVKLMFFNYGQAGVQQEHDSLVSHMVSLGLEPQDLQEIRIDIPWTKSSTLRRNLGGNIADSVGATYVELRNLIFASYALSYCESEKIDVLALGFIDVEGEAFTDANDTFIQDLRDLANRAVGIRVEAPFYEMTKLEVAKLGVDLGIDVFTTFSCNTPINGEPCGVCGDCKTVELIKNTLKKLIEVPCQI